MSREMALAKLDAELKSVKSKSDKQLAVPCINYMKERCREDDGLCEDVCKEEKKLEKCLAYITSQARKFLNEKASKVKKTEEKPKEKKAKTETKPKSTGKKDKNVIEGQMSIFDFMGV